jgi:hypothetical protein
MKTNYKLALAVLAGASIGGADAPFSHAYQIKTPPGYAFVEAGVTDPMSGYPCWCHAQEHAGERGKLARKTHHRHPAADIIQPAYEAIKPIRQSAAKSRLMRSESVARTK